MSRKYRFRDSEWKRRDRLGKKNEAVQGYQQKVQQGKRTYLIWINHARTFIKHDGPLNYLASLERFVQKTGFMTSKQIFALEKIGREHNFRLPGPDQNKVRREPGQYIETRRQQ